MDLLKKRTVLAINVGVWVAALTSATAVAFAASRPASLPQAAPVPDPQTSVECAPAGPFVSSVSEPTIYMPDDVIVGARPNAAGP